MPNQRQSSSRRRLTLSHAAAHTIASSAFPSLVVFACVLVCSAHTMMGKSVEGADGSSADMGLYALAARDMFRQIATGGERFSTLQVWVSFFGQASRGTIAYHIASHASASSSNGKASNAVCSL